MVEPDVPTAWWLGFWRAGEHLYWWTTAVSPTGDRAAVRAAVRGRVTRATWRQLFYKSTGGLHRTVTINTP